MMKEFAKKMKDNLDQLKTIPKDELKEDLKSAWTRQTMIEKSEALDELKELNDKIKMKIY
jgi:hypothetical protein